MLDPSDATRRRTRATTPATICARSYPCRAGSSAPPCPPRPASRERSQQDQPRPGEGGVRQRWHWRRCGGGWGEALRPQRPPAVRAASRATRCWDGCAGAQQLGRALSTCSSSRLQAKGIGRLRHHKVQLVYGELAIAIEVESLEGRLGRQLERLRHRVELLRRARRQNIACCAHVKTDERQWSGARGRRI